MERNDQFHSIISNLSEAHHETLKVLVLHFNKVVQNIEVNGQDYKTLCSYWARTMLGFDTRGILTDPDMPMFDPKKVVQVEAVMKTIMSNYEAIFRLDRLSWLMPAESEVARA